MGRTIRADLKEKTELVHFWRQFFQETPLCSLPGCGGVASEVDTHFPFIDDFNRCETHPLLPVGQMVRSAPARCRAAGDPAATHFSRWRRPAERKS